MLFAVGRRPPTLDYSSPAEEERSRLADEEAERSGVERYNLATFGEARPVRSAFFEHVVVVGVGVALVLLLPRPWGRLAAVACVVVYGIRKWRWDGWRVPTWAHLHRPTRWRD